MFTKTFTDPQGILHTDAVFQVKEATLNTNKHESFTYDFNSDSETTNDSGNLSLDFRCYYWPNQGAKDSGKPPYILTNAASANEYFHVNENELSDVKYDGLDLEAKVETYLNDTVLVEE